MTKRLMKIILVLTCAVWNGTIPLSRFQATEGAGSMQGVAGVTGDIGRGPQFVATNRLVDSSIRDIDIWADYLCTRQDNRTRNFAADLFSLIYACSHGNS